MQRLFRGAVRALWVGAWILAAAVRPAQAAEPADPAAEIRALREELRIAREEIQRLREENARLRGVPAVTITTEATAAGGPLATKPERAVETSRALVVEEKDREPHPAVVAPIAAGESVTAEALIAAYRESALAADARYKGRRFVIEGRVEGFRKQFVTSIWNIELAGTDPLSRVQCRTTFPGVSDFKAGADGRILEGRKPFRAWRPLLQQGETVALEGVCEGLKDGVIVFRECRPAGE